MNEQRHVTVGGVRLRFASSHMATLGDELEPLHGHNYMVSARVEGELTDDHWVIDFSALKRMMREACEALDHHFLLQARSSQVQSELVEGQWLIHFGDREYRFPERDVVALPIENSTAELLAQWLVEQAMEGLRAGGHANIRRLGVEVEEMPGQSGGYAVDL
jgi:6-pyruvoyltetrahydropterin/6-carboxytetrahydropterin synthase